MSARKRWKKSRVDLPNGQPPAVVWELRHGDAEYSEEDRKTGACSLDDASHGLIKAWTFGSDVVSLDFSARNIKGLDHQTVSMHMTARDLRDVEEMLAAVRATLLNKEMK